MCFLALSEVSHACNNSLAEMKRQSACKNSLAEMKRQSVRSICKQP